VKINLIPEIRQEQVRIQKTNALVTMIAIILAVVLGAIILLLSGMFLARMAQANQYNASITQINKNIKSQAALEKTVIDVSKGIQDVKSILGTDNKWKNFFSDLEKATPGDVRFKSLSITSDGKASAEMEARDVTSLDRFLTSFSTYKRKDLVTNTDKNNLFSDVVVAGYNVDDTGKINFSATFLVNLKEL